MHTSTLFAGLALLTTACASQASTPVATTAASCDEQWGDSDRLESVCETRTMTIPPRDLVVDAATNGGVRVEAWDRDEIEVEATVYAAAPTRGEAQRLLDATRIETRGTIRAESPDTRDRLRPDDAWVAASFVLRVPRRTDLDLTALNGGVAVKGVDGDIRAHTVNGGISLDGVAGNVRARTTNGGISIALVGDAFDGDGIDAETTNGGISIVLPRAFSADLTASTQMGRISADGLETTHTGQSRSTTTTRGSRTRERRSHAFGESIEGTIGGGGAPIRAVTTTGGVRIQRTR